MLPTLLRVLVIDDCADDFELVLRALREAGAARVHARREETEEGMIAALAEGTWDVVIVDWVLPQFSAPGALQLLRSRGFQMPCIVLSGTIAENAITCVKLGAQDFLPKEQLGLLADIIERELLFRE